MLDRERSTPDANDADAWRDAGWPVGDDADGTDDLPADFGRGPTVDDVEDDAAGGAVAWWRS